MKKIATWICDFPRTAVLIVLVLTAVSLVKIRNLEIDSSTHGLMNERDPKKELYEEFKTIFGSDTLTVVIIEAVGKDVFTTETLDFIDNLTAGLRDTEGVVGVQSLTTVKNIRGDGEYLNTDPLVLYVPEDEEELQTIRRNALENDTFIGNVVSKDGRFAAVNVYTEDGDDKTYDQRYLDNLQALIDQYKGNHEVYQIGAPRYNVGFNHIVEDDQTTLVPLAVVVVFLVLVGNFRSRVAVAVPMVTAGVSIAMTIGFMAWVGYAVGVVSVLVPSILIVVGCTEDVHLIAEYFRFRREGEGHLEAIRHAMKHGILAITLTSLTTVLGFIALSLNDITALREFGIICAFGLAANFISTIVMVPCVLRWFGPKAIEKVPQESKNPIVTRFLETIVRINREKRNMVFLFTAIILALAVWGSTLVTVNNDPVSFFAPGSPIRVDFGRIHDDMAGVQSFNIMFETQEEGDVLEPEVLKQVDMVMAHLRESGRFDKVIGLPDFVKMMNREMNNDPAAEVIPDNRGTIAEYLLLLDSENMFRYVDENNRYVSLVIRHNMSGSAEINDTLAGLENYLAANIHPYARDDEARHLHWRITGESILLNSAANAMISGQIESLGLALGAIFIIMSILFMSFKAGIIAMIANIVPILMNFGVMGWFDISLNTGTCMVATIALGIAVDDTIHFMVRYQECLRTTNDQVEAMALAVRKEGRPIIATSLALALGFLIMIASSFQPSGDLGLLSALVMIFALLTDLFITPMLLMAVQLISVWDYVSLRIRNEVLARSTVFRNLKEAEVKKVVLLGALDEIPAGEPVVKEGDAGDCMFLVLAGEVEVWKEGGHVATLGPGQIVGEMAMLGGGTRTATVKANVDSELLRIDHKALGRVEDRNPRIAAKLYANISGVLSNRLKDLTQKVF